MVSIGNGTPEINGTVYKKMSYCTGQYGISVVLIFFEKCIGPQGLILAFSTILRA